MNVTIDELQRVLKAKGYRFFSSGEYNLNIIGIRSENSKSNEFDDLMAVIYKDKMNVWQLKTYKITTDPGKHWLLKPLDRDGTAILVPGQYQGVYKVGIHGRTSPTGGYKALEQIREMKYVRDNNKDMTLDFDLYRNPDKAKKHIFSANIKTNIHRASAIAVLRNIERYSAGCQVFQDTTDFNEFMAICEEASARHGNSFTYTLIEERDFI